LRWGRNRKRAAGRLWAPRPKRISRELHDHYRESPRRGHDQPEAPAADVPIAAGPHFYPQDVAVDAQGTVYAAAVDAGTLKLAPGAQSAVSVGFTGSQFVDSGGVDAAGNIYVADDEGSNTSGSAARVQKRTAAGVQTVLPFRVSDRACDWR
jgi:hypothetical protein